mgnify:CR=1 FL=1
MKFVRLIAWGAVFIVAAVLGVKMLTDPSTSNKSSAIQATSGPGGPFTLTTHNGKIVTDKDFLGKYMMVYFGYSYCPDVCPLELQKLTSALLDLEKEGFDTSPIQPLFISIDPARDTPEALSEYIPLFHPSMIGLTGTEETVKAAAKEYKVYYAKRESDDVNEYLMDHLSVIFFMDQSGNYKQLFTAKHKPADIANALKPLLKKAA